MQFNDGSYEMPANPSTSSWTVSRTFNTAGTFTYSAVSTQPGMARCRSTVPAGEPPARWRTA